MQAIAAFAFFSFGLFLLVLFAREVASKRKVRHAEPVRGRVLSLRKAERDPLGTDASSDRFEVQLSFEIAGDARRSYLKTFPSKRDAEQWLDGFPVGSEHWLKLDPLSSHDVYLAGDDEEINPTALVVGILLLGAGAAFAVWAR